MEKTKKSKKKNENSQQKKCPSCDMFIPSACHCCPLCNFDFTAEEDTELSKGELSGFTMSEIDLLTQKSNWRWCDIFGDEAAFMASGFNAFSGVFFLNNHWYCVGGSEDGLKFLICGTKEICLAKADDFLNENETADNAYKSKRWLNESASTRQLQCLPQEYRNDFSITKYHAANLLKFHFNKYAIQKLLFEVDAKRKDTNFQGGAT